jgi:hypothetical protein
MAMVEDWEYWLRAAKQFTIGHIKGVYPYRYRWHPNSLTCTRRGPAIAQQIRARALHLVPPEQRLEYTRNALYGQVWTFHREGNLGAALHCAVECWKLAPWRLRYLRTVLGTGLRYLRSNREPDPTYLFARDTKRYQPLDAAGQPSKV